MEKSELKNLLEKTLNNDFHDLIIIHILSKTFNFTVGFNYFKYDDKILKLYYYINNNEEIYPYFLVNNQEDYTLVKVDDIDNVYNINKDIYIKNIIKKEDFSKLGDKYKKFEYELNKKDIDFDYIPKDILRKYFKK